MLPFDPPENRKTGFLMFLEGLKGNIGKKRVKFLTISAFNYF